MREINGDMLDKFKRGELKGDKLKEFLDRRKRFRRELVGLSLEREMRRRTRQKPAITAKN